MSKIIKLELTGGFGLYEDDCPYIIEKVNDIHGEITDVDFENAIDVLISAFVKKNINRLYINIDERNMEYTPVKEMTLEDIEEALGYKLKIVNK